jgi:GNAT superfamily N-acetyltransferase
MINPDDLIIESEPADADVEFLDDRLYDYNMAQTGYRDGRRLAIFVRDAEQAIVAGLDGWTWGGSGEIRSIWVDPSLRGQGVGASLMQAAEREAWRRGCRQLMLGSFSFQAPHFYRSLGYTVFAALDGHPKGHQLYMLYKRLSAPPGEAST